MWATFEAENDPVNQKKEKIKYLNQNGEIKLNSSDYCMFMMEAPEYLLKKLEAHVDEPRNMFEIIRDKYDKKCNNKLSNICN